MARIPEVDSYNEVYRSVGILAKWHDKTFDDFTGDPLIKKFILDYVAASAETPQHKGVLLTGEYGLGKTLLMNLAFKEFVRQRYTCQVISFPMLVSYYTRNWKGEAGLSKLMNVQYLGIDDAGKEFSYSDVSKELVTSAFDYVLRYRTQDNKATWITSNLAAGSFKSTYSNAIASLLTEACFLCEVDGTDYRGSLLQTVKPNKDSDTGESSIFNTRKK